MAGTPNHPHLLEDLNLKGFFLIVLLASLGSAACALDEFKLKRQEDFAFTEKPSITRRGDRVEIAFASKAFCDATVAVEDPQGKIIRHLASGVLGPNAPAPFQKNALEQKVTWDGKDDQGIYRDDKDTLRIRVSLGLRGSLEQIHYASPWKRESPVPAIMRAAPEGVYVYDGSESLDFVRLYSHEGEYLRTVYPFPADKIKSVQGLDWHAYPQDGKLLPIKGNFLQNSFLTCGVNGADHTWDAAKQRYLSVVSSGNGHFGMFGHAATAMDVLGERLVLAQWKVQWLGTDGTSAGLDMRGPAVSYPVVLNTIHEFQGGTYQIPPRSLALSADGKWLYLSGYLYSFRWHVDGLHGVIRVPVGAEAGGKSELFAGSMKQDERSSEPGKLAYPASVVCDSQNRVYVADYLNDRVQVYSPEGKVLKTIATPKPAHLELHAKTGELYVFSWAIRNNVLITETDRLLKIQKQLLIPAQLTRFGSFDKPDLLASCPLPLMNYSEQISGWDGGRAGHQYRVALDSYAEHPTIWISPDGQSELQLWVEKNGKLELKRDFAGDFKKSGVTRRLIPYRNWRLFVNPKTGCAYLGEGHTADGTGIEKGFKDLFEINPTTGKTRQVELPFTTEDLCFDLEGRAYLRGNTHLARYEFESFREVPWDYGEEQEQVGFGSSASVKWAKTVSALPIFDRINWHQGGMSVSAKGNLAVSCYGIKELQVRTDEKKTDLALGKSYQPRMYPGRILGGKSALVHVWNKHGQVLYEDAVPGLPHLGGVEIDREDNLYILSNGVRMAGDKPYFNDLSGTLLKFKPGKGKLVTNGRTPIPLETPPSRPSEVITSLNGPGWIEGAEWLCGGLGYFGKVGVGCGCWNTRFALDYFGRSFVPERDRYDVAVLDSNGNVLLRLGNYGNADSSGAQSKIPAGGDEIALMLGSFVATHTDQRLFISDPGNARILSVKLDYYSSEQLPLKGVSDTGK